MISADDVTEERVETLRSRDVKGRPIVSESGLGGEALL